MVSELLEGETLRDRLAGLAVVDIETGARQPWPHGPGAPPPGGLILNVVLGRDGRTYAYTLREDASTLYLAEGLR